MINVDEIKRLFSGYNKENANLQTSNVTSEKEIVSTILRRYYLEHLVPKEVAHAHLNGDIHIHDLDLVDRPNCLQHPYELILKYGLRALSCDSRPAKYIQVAINQFLKALALAQAHMAGGQSLPLFNVLLAPYAHGVSDKELEQTMQHFVYELNQLQASRGLQTIFSSVNCEYGIPKFLENETIEYGPHKGNCFGDFEEESKRILNALCNVLLEKDASGRPFLFPNFITVYRNETKDDKLLEKVIEVNMKTGNGYWLNMEKYGNNLADCMGAVRGDYKILIKYNDEEKIVTLEELWNMFYPGNSEWYGKTEYFRTLDKELYVYDSRNGFVKIKTIMRTEDMSNWWYIETEDNVEFVATADHPLPIIRDNKEIVCRMDELKVGDTVYITKKVGNSYILAPSKIITIMFIGKIGIYSYDIETESGYFTIIDKLYSHNCRTYLDDTFTGNWKHDAVGTGNLEYCTINLPRIAMRHIIDNLDIYDLLQDVINLAIQALLVRRNIIWTNWHNGLYPFFYKYNDEEYGYYYNIPYTTMSIGFVGLHEFITLLDEDRNFGLNFIKEFRKMVDELNEYSYDELAKKFDIKYDNKGTEEYSRWSLIASPAESAAGRLKTSDLSNPMFYHLLEVSNLVDKTYYTNSFHVPEDSNVTAIEKIKMEAPFHKYCNGGSITHIWSTELDADYTVLGRFVKKVVNSTDVRYFTFSPTIIYCENCKKSFIGNPNTTKCMYCDSENVSYYSKITGYLQKTENWNIHKKQEWVNRFHTNKVE